jgi:hypothetical protein
MGSIIMNIKICNVNLPNINYEWIEKHSTTPPFPEINIDDFLLTKPPQTEVFRGRGCNTNFFLGKKAYETTTRKISGRMIYPPNGYMDWHTNGDCPGTRMYAAWSETGDSGMMFLDKDGIPYIDQDIQGWNIRTFDCPTWHNVWSRCWRVSIGWNLKEAPDALENMVFPTE